MVGANAYSASTQSGYASHIRAYLLFCLYFDFNPLPGSDVALSQFFVFQSQTVAPQSLQIYCAGIRSFHLDNGFPWLHISARPGPNRILRGLKRIYGVGAKPKLAITLEILAKMRNFLDFSDHNDVNWWAAALVCFFACLRKDNCTVEKESSFNSSANLCRGDFGPQLGWSRVLESALWVRIRRSKTNQVRARVHMVPLMPVRGSDLCPVTAVVHAFSFFPDTAPGAAPFTQRERNGAPSPLTHGSFVRKLKSLITYIGMSPDDYSGHSFRIGAATLSFQLTPKHELIKGLGDWASDAYLGYNRATLQTRCLLPTLMAMHASRISRASPPRS